MSDFGERVFEEQVFAQEEEDAGTGAAAQHDEDSGHGANPQWVWFIQTVDVRTFETRNSLVPASTGYGERDVVITQAVNRWTEAGRKRWKGFQGSRLLQP